jgi:hypothetical protein
MRFYYMSLFSLVLVGLIYVFGTIFLVWLGKILKNRWDGAWKLMVPLFPLLYIGPIAEELWIAWNFGRLCKKDAGLFIYRTAEVQGFYDDTTHWWRQLAESDYQFVESRDNTFGGLYRVERDGGKLKHFEIERPTARYQITKPHDHTAVAYKTKMFEWLVQDTSTSQVLAREKTYARSAPWFFIGVDRRTIFCKVSGRQGEKLHVTIYDQVLKPME